MRITATPQSSSVQSKCCRSASQLQQESKIATIWTTSYSKTAAQTHVVIISMWWHSTFYCHYDRLAHQLYSCQHGCRLLSHSKNFHNALCRASATSTIHTAAFYLILWRVIRHIAETRWPAHPYSSSGADSGVVLRHRAAAAACACLTVDAAAAVAYCTPDDAADVFLHNHCPNSRDLLKFF